MHRQLTKHRFELHDVEADVVVAAPTADAADAAAAAAAAASDSGSHAAISGRAAAVAGATTDAAASAPVDPARLSVSARTLSERDCVGLLAARTWHKFSAAAL